MKDSAEDILKKRQELAENCAKAFARDFIKYRTSGNPDECYNKIFSTLQDAYLAGVKFADENPLWPRRKLFKAVNTKYIEMPPFVTMKGDKSEISKYAHNVLLRDFGDFLLKQGAVEINVDLEHSSRAFVPVVKAEAIVEVCADKKHDQLEDLIQGRTMFWQ